ncbi:DEAD/DEAH box helicase [Alienimonas sp. DA493]|uniref:DEAD/DEAH box helicase n=1 Tax=Alienimonas sp. DA493 TaxID=3373605 RepID=UPI003754053E
MPRPSPPSAAAPGSAPPHGDGEPDALDRLLPDTAVQPRPYQARIVRQALDHFAGRHVDSGGVPSPAARSVLIESPTGSGKTVMGLLIAKLLQEEFGVTVGWAAMRRNLLSQTEAENAAKRIGVDPLVTVSMFDKNPPPGLELLIVDEAQHDAAASMAHLHNQLRPRWILGLTATPYRTDKMKLCFDRVLRDAGIHQLIGDGYLSRYDHFSIPAHTPTGVAQTYLRNPDRWGKSIAFFRTRAECAELEEQLNSGGVRCETVTGDSDRDAQLARFQSGETRVLVNCMVLTEGFDSPDLQTVFCRDSAKGPTVQMCGRVFRTHPAVPIKQIVQSRSTKWPFTRVAGARRQYLWEPGGAADDLIPDDEPDAFGWRSLTANPRINKVSARTRLAIAKTNVRLPEVLRPAPRPFGR